MDWGWLTGFADWFKKSPPETLVFGAELRCLHGSQNTYLIVNHTDKEIEGLPVACVTDRVEFDNIMTFGECYQNGYCCDLMKLRDRWDNNKPQDILLNGEEVITTESILICERCGGMIWAVNSGQDGKGAEWLSKDLAFIKMMMEKYPGLLEVMSDPNGSIYLTEGMYDIAMKFLSDCWQNSGCNMNLISLFDQSSSEGIMMRNVMERLLPGFDMTGIDKFRDDLMMKATEKGYDIESGWNVDILNKSMFSLLKEECERTKIRMEEDPFYRWQEEHRNFMYTLSNAASILTYYLVANKGLGSKRGAEGGKVQQDGMGKNTGKTIPDKVKRVLEQIKANNGTPPKGYKGGRTYNNQSVEGGAQKLPEGVHYREYDVNPYTKGQNRGSERIVIGDDGSAWYTKDHYRSFIKIE